jgi:hypothetical protein
VDAEYLNMVPWSQCWYNPSSLQTIVQLQQVVQPNLPLIAMRVGTGSQMVVISARQEMWVQGIRVNDNKRKFLTSSLERPPLSMMRMYKRMNWKKKMTTMLKMH